MTKLTKKKAVPAPTPSPSITPEFDWENDIFEDASSTDLIVTASSPSPISPSTPTPTPTPTLTPCSPDTPFGQVVEDTFKQHFSSHGYQAIDLLSKVDPNNYIKHVVALVPKQVATKSVTEVTTNGVTVSRELIQSLDIISGVSPLPAFSLPDPVPEEEYPW